MGQWEAVEADCSTQQAVGVEEAPRGRGAVEGVTVEGRLTAFEHEGGAA